MVQFYRFSDGGGHKEMKLGGFFQQFIVIYYLIVAASLCGFSKNIQAAIDSSTSQKVPATLWCEAKKHCLQVKLN